MSSARAESDVERTAAHGAVFLSYARDDAGTAKRICEVLRAAGVEVWFDQDELTGGDEWDAKIRGQIGSCALFMPVISAHTQERLEGYFRLEWKLAEDRSYLMAKGKPFIVPVVVDATGEKGAQVPDAFLKVQWTRLPGGEATPAFVERVKKLLGAPEKGTSSPVAGLAEAGHPAFAAASGGTPGSATPATTKRVPAWIWGAAVLGFVAIGAVLVVMRKTDEVASPVSAAAESKPATHAPTPAVVSDKSIAVLPFENMSEAKDNAFFADGVHEDVLTCLSKVSDLKVIARTSVMEYRSTTKKIQQIARELGVAYVLEGSVRRSGNRVRVVCQLIDGRTGQHVLAPDPYDRDLSDIFAIQSEIARSIASKLQAVLAPGENAHLERTPTANLAAYDLCLKAREILDREPNQRLRAERARVLLESALQYDPKFAEAWFGLGTLHLGAYYRFDQTESRRLLAKEAIEKARELDPHNGGILALQTNYFIDVRDLPRARELATQLEREFPRLAVTYHVLARLNLREGQLRETLDNYRKAQNLDPRNLALLDSLTGALISARRYDEALAFVRESAELNQTQATPRLEWYQAVLPFYAHGSTREMEVLVRKLTPEAESGDKWAISVLAGWASMRGDADGVIRLWERHGSDFSTLAGRESFTIASALLVKGQKDRARPILEQEREQYRTRLASRPDNIDNWFYLAATHALLGEKDETFAVKREMLAANPGLTERALAGFQDQHLLAWLGEKDAALAELAQRLAKGYITTPVNVMRRSLNYSRLQGDPRFEALLNDPKNNAPLF